MPWHAENGYVLTRICALQILDDECAVCHRILAMLDVGQLQARESFKSHHFELCTRISERRGCITDAGGCNTDYASCRSVCATWPLGELAGLPIFLVYGRPTILSQASTLATYGENDATTSESLSKPEPHKVSFKPFKTTCNGCFSEHQFSDSSTQGHAVLQMTLPYSTISSSSLPTSGVSGGPDERGFRLCAQTYRARAPATMPADKV